MARTTGTKPKPKTEQITLTKSQFEELRTLIDENSIEEIEDICTSGEDDMKTIGFTLGGIYSDLRRTFSRLEEILDEVDPSFTMRFIVDDEDDEDENA